MTEMTFEVVQGDYGEDIAVHFDYDEHLTERMRELREDPIWQQTHCTPVYDENDNFQHWTIDRSEESVETFHDVVGYPIPRDVQPDSGGAADGGEVLIEVPEGDTRFYVRDHTDEIDGVLDSTFSYQNPDAEHSAMAPPFIHIYDAQRHCGPMGLLERAAEAVEALGYDVTTEVHGDRSGEDIETAWQFEHDLRGYQEAAMASVLEHGGGIVSLPTGAGKTVTALAAVDAIGQDAVVFVHTKELLHQWADEVRDILGVEPGVIGDGEWSQGPITICTMQTLMSKGIHRIDDPGVMIFDECHRTSAADTMNEIGMSLDAEYRIGLSATPWRRISGAELKIEGAVGGVAHEVTAEYLIGMGYLSEPRFEVLEHSGPKARGSEEYHEAYERCIEHSDARNEAIARRAARCADEGYKTLVNINRVDQGQLLAEALNEQFGAEAAFLSGSDPTSRRERVLEDFEHGSTDVLVSTLIKEGVDLPEMDAVILAHGGKSDISTLQVIGRALRPQGGKDHALVVDVADEGRFFGHAHRQRQETMAEYYEGYGPDADREVDTESTGTEKTSLTEPMSDEEMAEMEDWLTGGGDGEDDELDDDVGEVADWLGMDAAEVDQ